MTENYAGWNPEAQELMSQLDTAAEHAEVPVVGTIAKLSDEDLSFLNRAADAERRKRLSPAETQSRQERQRIATLSNGDLENEWTKLK